MVLSYLTDRTHYVSPSNHWSALAPVHSDGNIEEFHATSNRVASVTIRISKRYKIRIIQVYAPTSVSSQEELEEFYDDLQTEMRKRRLIIMS